VGLKAASKIDGNLERRQKPGSPGFTARSDQLTLDSLILRLSAVKPEPPAVRVVVDSDIFKTVSR